jgi:glycosyltransferase involved in cell wall biosynthesis
MTSIIIPVYKEPHLNKTIDSLLANAENEVEVLVVLDGDIPQEPVRNDPRVRIITLENNLGMRGALNAGITNAKGDFLMKVDAHCAFCPGYDKVLTEDCAENWLMAPSRYSLDEQRWGKGLDGKAHDYHYLSYPQKEGSLYGYSMQVQNWNLAGREHLIIDDTMTFQGSSWFVNRKYFKEHVGLYDDRPETYGTFSQDQQEVGLKYWLGGGEIKVNKKIWYAHLRKGRGHYKSGLFSFLHKKDKLRVSGDVWGTRHWMCNEEPGMIHKFEWLLEKFWPVPTWPEDRSLWEYKK